MTTTEFNGKKLFRWEPSDGSAVFLGSYVLKLLLQVIIVIVLGVTDVDPDFSKTIAYACIITSSNEIAFLLTPLAYGKIKGYDTIRGMGFEGRFSLWATLLVIPLSVALICMGQPLAEGFVRLVALIGYDTSAATSIMPSTPGELAATLILVALLPAIAEEYVFRGCVARAFARKGYVFAVFMSALLFAIMHGSPLQLVHQFLIGVVCAVLFFATRSLWPPIILHFLNNAIALVLGYVQSAGSAFALTEVWQYVVMCVVGVAATIGLLIAVIYLCKARAAKVDPESGAAKRADMERTLRSLYESPEVRGAAQAELDALDAELAEAKSEQMAEVIKEARRESANKTKLRDRRALIYAFLFAGVLWILMFILNIAGVQ
ncbi:MAG TPA: CPBP family intramembrane metalloprotease [Candidatus Ornithoclostridium faecigallinarum]|nr:CPBP family intramembrane metalloprotease [Candidatus Ornithoclostridium faecigallinarum]